MRLMDIVSSSKRSKMMARIRGKDTAPERAVRKMLFTRGYRYRLHSDKFPGKPDIVLKKYKAVLFVNGCFWHKHTCHMFKWPQSNASFWREKISQTSAKDHQNIEKILSMGWRVCVIWECALKGKKDSDIHKIMESLFEWLKGSEKWKEIP